MWSTWEIGQCTATCGKGNRQKNRKKLLEEKDGGICRGDYHEIEDCNMKKCPGTTHFNITTLQFLSIYTTYKSGKFFFQLQQIVIGASGHLLLVRQLVDKEFDKRPEQKY